MTRLKGGKSGGPAWLLWVVLLIIVLALLYFFYLKPQGIVNLGF